MVFALSFLWTYYSIKSAIWAAALAAILALCSAYLIYRAQNKVGQIKSAKKQNKKAVANLYDYLKYNDDNAAVFADLYRYYHYDVHTVDFDNFIAEKDGVTTYVTLLYAKDSVNSADIASAVVAAKRSKADKLRIYAAKIDAAALKNAAQRFDADFVDAANAFKLLEQSGKLPAVPDVKQRKNSFAAQYAFCRKRFGWYFGSCIFMTLISIVAYFPFYTLAWATVMLILALYSLLNTRYNVRQTDVTLD